MDVVFPSFVSTYSDPEWLAERAILATLNKIVSSINKKRIQMMPDGSTFTSSDSTITEEEAIHYPTEFLNSIKIAGLPSHKLIIKIGMPVMMMGSLTPPRVMNGTRCVVIKVSPNTVIALEPYKGEIHCILRISQQPSDITLPFSLSRRQFPIQPRQPLNKAQGQTMKYIGLHLAPPVFSHGILYA